MGGVLLSSTIRLFVDGHNKLGATSAAVTVTDSGQFVKTPSGVTAGHAAPRRRA
jgi:hypothetical protein